MIHHPQTIAAHTAGAHFSNVTIVAAALNVGFRI